MNRKSGLQGESIDAIGAPVYPQPRAELNGNGFLNKSDAASNDEDAPPPLVQVPLTPQAAMKPADVTSPYAFNPAALSTLVAAGVAPPPMEPPQALAFGMPPTPMAHSPASDAHAHGGNDHGHSHNHGGGHGQGRGSHGRGHSHGGGHNHDHGGHNHDHGGHNHDHGGHSHGGHDHGGHSHGGHDHGGHSHGGHSHGNEDGENDSASPSWDKWLANDFKLMAEASARGSAVRLAELDAAGKPTDVWAAVQFGNEETLEQVLRQSGAPKDWNALDKRGNTLLHYAARRPSLRLAKALLERGAAPTSRSSNELQESPLHGAIAAGDMELALLLLQHGADARAPNAKGYDALITAVQYGRVLLTAYLLRAGSSSVDAVDLERHTPLHWAAYMGNARLVRMLINHNANVAAQDANGMTAMHWAAAKGYLPVLEELTTSVRGNDEHSEPNVYGQLEARDKNNQVPFEYAQKNNQRKTAEYLHMIKHQDFNDGFWTGRKYRFPRAVLCAFLLQCGFFMLFSLLPGWAFLLVIMGLWMSGQQRRLYPLIYDNHPAFIAVFISGQAFAMYLLATKIAPNAEAMGVTGLLVLRLIIALFYCDLYRRLVMHSRGKFIQHRREEVASLIREGAAADPRLYCQSCLIRKVPRAKHCSDCDRCVEKFDHQCVWTSRCISLKNYRTFCMFAVFFTADVWLFTYMAVKYVRMTDLTATSWSVWSMFLNQEPFFMAYLFWVNLNAFMIFLLVVFHLYLISKNLTTNETMHWSRYDYLKDEYGMFKNPYDRGIVRNWMEFLRPRPLAPSTTGAQLV